jgi:hypothetical protein
VKRLAEGGTRRGGGGEKYGTKKAQRYKMPSPQDLKDWIKSTDEPSEEESWSGRDGYH